MKNRIKTIIPRMHNCDSFNDFQDMFKTFRLHVGVDDIPLTDDNIVQMGKELWLEIKLHAKDETAVREFESDKNPYASYILRTKKGTRGKHGSSISEINHSSILVHLNEGMKHGNHYSEKPHTLVKDLFVRQEKHIIRWNQQIYNEYNDLLLMRSKINKTVILIYIMPVKCCV